MSKHFPHAFDSILKEARTRFTAASLAASANLSAPDVSRLRNGTASPGHYIQSLLGSDLLDDLEKSRLLIAYLRDEIPAGLTEKIQITLADGTGTLHETDQTPVDAALDYLRRRCQEDPSFADWIVDFTSIAQGKTPSPGVNG